MANAKQIIAAKQLGVVSIAPQATVLDAAQVMNEKHIGALLVLDGTRLVGIFTERDVMRRVVAAGEDPAKTKVRDVMTKQVAVASPHTTCDELRTVMREKCIRHVPVVESDTVIGLVSIGDLNRAVQEVQEETIRYLEQYMSVP
ncbi:MAG: CBS domain-containing protein [Planctomycetes bacterium]|nr:CBS domain-containing protein [Planctomycetota bacterium]